jgi:hypothetical protein
MGNPLKETMARGAELGEAVCRAFDDFSRTRKSPGAETWEMFLERVHEEHLRVDPAAAFDGLLWILINKPTYVHQNVAGSLLSRFKIPCRIGLSHFLEILLFNFDASAQETVTYLNQVFGKAAVKKRIDELAEMDLSEREELSIHRLRSWLAEQEQSSAGAAG